MSSRPRPLDIAVSILAGLAVALTAPVWLTTLLAGQAGQTWQREPERILAGACSVGFALAVVGWAARESSLSMSIAPAGPFVAGIQRAYTWLMNRLIPWREAHREVIRQARLLQETARQIKEGR